MAAGPPDIIAVSVGNTRTRLGAFQAGELNDSAVFPNTDDRKIVSALAELSTKAGVVPVVFASVNDPFTAEIIDQANRAGVSGTYRLGKDLPIPIQHTLIDPTTVGQDRLLNALAAYARARQACIVIDAGTAVTVDFVDGEGTFHGGAIAPGLNMMLKSLHDHTAALPLLKFEEPAGNGTPFGKDTRGAMLRGVQAAAQGAVHHLVDKYADFYQAYPQIIATGGDAATLFEDDAVVEHIVPDLTLMGILFACQLTLADDELEEPEGLGSDSGLESSDNGDD